MKSMQIYEPAMCCSTGLCGVSIDPELLRISTVLNSMNKNGVTVERFNLSDSPQQFITNQIVNKFINEKGVDELPITVLDGEIVISGRYPSNEEFVQLLDIPVSVLGKQKIAEEASGDSDGCCCSGGSCC